MSERPDGIARRLRTFAVAGAIGLTGACGVERILQPAAPAVAALAVAATTVDATRSAQPDAARVRLARTAGVIFDSTFAFPAGSQEVRLRVEVELQQQSETVDVIVDLLEAGRVVESGGTQATLEQGRTTSAPVQVSSGLLFEMISTGDNHACGVTTLGDAFCWGSNTNGQLGDGTTTNSPFPVRVSTNERFRWIGAGNVSTCGLTLSDSVLCWGGNQSGQLGDGTKTDRAVPGPITGPATFTRLAVSAYQACAKTPAAETYCWGSGGRTGIDFGALGVPAPETCVGYYAGDWPCSATPLQVPGSYTSVISSLWFSCGLTTTKQAECWGWNTMYQLGSGDTAVFSGTYSTTARAVAGGLRFEFMDTGASVSCGLVAGGAAYCWGGRFFNNGQLGDGTFVSTGTPVPVSGGLSFRSIRPSKGNDIYSHTCAVTTGDVAYCWGINTYGQLGLTATQTCQAATTVPCTAVPLPVDGGLAFRDVSTGAEYTCGVTLSGEGYCWGRNPSGQLGNGTLVEASIPTRVVRQ